MKAVTKFLAGAAMFAVAAGGFAAPAAAQYYPGYGYGGGGGGLGAIIDAILGAGRYGGYGYNQGQQRFLVEQCARATEARLQRNYGYAYNPYGGYGGYGGGYGAPYGNYGNYGYQGGARIVAITHIRPRSSGGLKIFGTATSGRMPAGGYGGYGNYGYGYNTVADLQFDCSVDYRGRVTDVDVSRNRYGYSSNPYRGY